MRIIKLLFICILPCLFTLAFISEPGGTTVPSPKTYIFDEGTKVRIKAEPKTHYGFPQNYNSEFYPTHLFAGVHNSPVGGIKDEKIYDTCSHIILFCFDL
jgi:hypothetical protein